LFEIYTKVGNINHIAYLVANTSTAASSPHNWLNLCWEETDQVILAKSWQNNFNIAYQACLKSTIC